MKKTSKKKAAKPKYVPKPAPKTVKKSTPKPIHEEIFTVGRSIALVSAIILAISAFLPWGYTDYVLVTGFAGKGGDGLITVAIGILAFVLLFIKRLHLWVSLILGLIGLGIGAVDFYNMSLAVTKIAGAIGSGLYLTVLASAGIVLGTIVEFFEERKKKNLFYLDEDL